MQKATDWNLQQQLELALQWQLEQMLKLRSKFQDWRDIGAYFSASDLERRLRAAASEMADKKPYGYYENHSSHHRLRIHGLGGHTLLHHCRRFLISQVAKGTLRMDQPSGYRVSSGLRFRPAENELTEAEKKTAEKRQTPKISIVHYNRPEYSRDETISQRHPICRPEKGTKRFQRRNLPIRITTHPEDVTCKNCLKLLKKLPHPLAPELKADTHLGIVADYLEEKGQDVQELRNKILKMERNST